MTSAGQRPMPPAGRRRDYRRCSLSHNSRSCHRVGRAHPGRTRQGPHAGVQPEERACGRASWANWRRWRSCPGWMLALRLTLLRTFLACSDTPMTAQKLCFCTLLPECRSRITKVYSNQFPIQQSRFQARSGCGSRLFERDQASAPAMPSFSSGWPLLASPGGRAGWRFDPSAARDTNLILKRPNSQAFRAPKA